MTFRLCACQWAGARTRARPREPEHERGAGGGVELGSGAGRRRSCGGSARSLAGWLAPWLAAAAALRSGRSPRPVDGGVRLNPRDPPPSARTRTGAVAGGDFSLDPTLC